MLLGANAQSVSLAPVGYESGDASSAVTAVSDDWIVIDGEITTSRGAWTFRDSSLLAVECLELSEWLADVAKFQIKVTESDDRPTLTFIEPSLAFSVALYEDQSVGLRVHLTHLAAPPWPDIDPLNTGAFFVEIALEIGELKAAIADWNREAGAFPPRTRRM